MLPSLSQTFGFERPIEHWALVGLAVAYAVFLAISGVHVLRFGGAGLALGRPKTRRLSRFAIRAPIAVLYFAAAGAAATFAFLLVRHARIWHAIWASRYIVAFAACFLAAWIGVIVWPEAFAHGLEPIWPDLTEEEMAAAVRIMKLIGFLGLPIAVAFCIMAARAVLAY